MMGICKRLPCVFFTFPVTLRGQETEQIKEANTETDRIITTEVLKQMCYPDLFITKFFILLPSTQSVVTFPKQYKATTEGLPRHSQVYVRPQDSPKTPRF